MRESRPLSSGHGSAIEFYGKHQAGIATPAQDRLAFAAFDVTSLDKAAVQTMLARWAAAGGEEHPSIPDHRHGRGQDRVWRITTALAHGRTPLTRAVRR